MMTPLLLLLLLLLVVVAATHADRTTATTTHDNNQHVRRLYELGHDDEEEELPRRHLSEHDGDFWKSFMINIFRGNDKEEDNTVVSILIIMNNERTVYKQETHSSHMNCW